MYSRDLWNRTDVPTFDAVLCLDVMEHILEQDTFWVLNDIKDNGGGKAIFCIHTGIAIHRLPNGENCHCTVKSEEWWLNRLRAVFGIKVTVHKRFGKNIVVLVNAE